MDRVSGGESNDRQGFAGTRATGDPCAVIRNAAPDRPFVVAQLGQSLDGRIATRTGESRWISQAPALDHLHRLRAAVDAVVVGIGTVLADDPQLNVRRVPGRHPARVVIDPSGKLPGDARCLRDDGARRLVLRDCEAPAPAGVEVVRVSRAGSWLDPHTIIAALYERGFRRLLIEGGARTVSAFIDAGAIDRLHVLVSPVILGSGRCGLELAPITTMNEALRPPTDVYVLGEGDVLFDCDLRNARAIRHVEQS
jgi:riboflavin-specific deaminase-like protein